MRSVVKEGGKLLERWPNSVYGEEHPDLFYFYGSGGQRTSSGHALVCRKDEYFHKNHHDIKWYHIPNPLREAAQIEAEKKTVADAQFFFYFERKMNEAGFGCKQEPQRPTTVKRVLTDHAIERPAKKAKANVPPSRPLKKVKANVPPSRPVKKVKADVSPSRPVKKVKTDMHNAPVLAPAVAMPAPPPPTQTPALTCAPTPLSRASASTSAIVAASPTSPPLKQPTPALAQHTPSVIPSTKDNDTRPSAGPAPAAQLPALHQPQTIASAVAARIESEMRQRYAPPNSPVFGKAPVEAQGTNRDTSPQIMNPDSRRATPPAPRRKPNAQSMNHSAQGDGIRAQTTNQPEQARMNGTRLDGDFDAKTMTRTTHRASGSRSTTPMPSQTPQNLQQQQVTRQQGQRVASKFSPSLKHSQDVQRQHGTQPRPQTRQEGQQHWKDEQIEIQEHLRMQHEMLQRQQALQNYQQRRQTPNHTQQPYGSPFGFTRSKNAQKDTRQPYGPPFGFTLSENRQKFPQGPSGGYDAYQHWLKYQYHEGTISSLQAVEMYRRYVASSHLRQQNRGPVQQHNHHPVRQPTPGGSQVISQGQQPSQPGQGGNAPPIQPHQDLQFVNIQPRQGGDAPPMQLHQRLQFDNLPPDQRGNVPPMQPHQGLQFGNLPPDQEGNVMQQHQDLQFSNLPPDQGGNIMQQHRDLQFVNLPPDQGDNVPPMQQFGSLPPDQGGYVLPMQQFGNLPSGQGGNVPPMQQHHDLQFVNLPPGQGDNAPFTLQQHQDLQFVNPSQLDLQPRQGGHAPPTMY